MYLFETKIINDTTRLRIILVLIVSLILTSSGFGLPANQISIHPNDSGNKANSIYHVELKLENDIPANATILCRFPESFDLKNVIIAGSTTINGGFELKVKDNTVIMQRSGLGHVIKANTPVDLKFAEVIAPDVESVTYTIQVEVTVNSTSIARQDVNVVVKRQEIGK